MKFLRLFAKSSIISLFPLLSFGEDSSLFYKPTEKEEKKYHITQNSYMEVLYGDSHNREGKDLTSFNHFNKGRLNARSVLEAKDLESNYSALLDVQIGTDVSEDQSKMFYIRQGYIELQNAEQPIKTKVRIGIQNPANTTFAVNSSTPMKNNQGIDGNWLRFTQMPVVNQNGGYNPTFILKNGMLSSQGFTDATFLYSKNSGNLNYVQPSPLWSLSNLGIAFALDRFFGFKFAASYQPSQNTGNFGVNGNGGYDRRGVVIDLAGNTMFTKNLTSVVLNYLNEFHGIAVNSSIGYEHATFHTNTSIVDIQRYNLSQYTAGLNLSYLGLTIGGSYSNSGKSLLIKHNQNQINSFSTRNAGNLTGITSASDLYNISQNSNVLDFGNSYNYDFGASYTIGAFQGGIAHAKSKFAGNNFNITLISLSEDMRSSNKMKLTAMYELGFYEFNSASYFKDTGSGITIVSVPRMKGIMGSIGLKVSI